MSGSTDRQYLIEQLTRIADGELDEIIDRRASAIGKTIPEIAHRSQWQSHEYAQILNQARESFWDSPLDETLKKLDAIDCVNYPEFESSVERLKRAAKATKELQLATLKMKPQRRKFLGYFKAAITSSPQRIADIKQTVFQNGLRFPIGNQYRNDAKLIAKEFPTLRAIDPVWIDEVASEKRIGKVWNLVDNRVWLVIATVTLGPLIGLIIRFLT